MMGGKFPRVEGDSISLHKSFREAYSLADARKTRYQIDLSRAEYIDSAALGMLRCSENGRVVTMRVSGSVAAGMKYSGFCRFQDSTSCFYAE